MARFDVNQGSVRQWIALHRGARARLTLKLMPDADISRASAGLAAKPRDASKPSAGSNPVRIFAMAFVAGLLDVVNPHQLSRVLLIVARSQLRFVEVAQTRCNVVSFAWAF